ncbi:polysaccharide deacetylase family protein [Chitinophaga japonensis]|uniref:ChbG/HpnK family deacetylase n=1 Tax=Chitinophaga japonensis TaxID=104662 RepID=A0A562SYF1_CHIJA|nr:polysaccharide deacetylase family protein [Chitinophaga japonensis]TWI86223.1 hypothetical protein LX66_3475 [Chitinophaga japonensis]
MKNSRYWLCHATLFLLLFPFIVIAQNQGSLPEKLGYPRDARLLIVHADDLGVSHSTNAAAIAAFEQKAINSASIMVPCPWFPEIAAYAKAHPELDWGIHITLTAEWKYYKWDGVSPAGEIPSLLDKDGYFYASVREFQQHAKPEEVAREIRAQIRKALDAGINITHLDNHMGSLLGSPELAKIYQEIGREFNLPVLIPAKMIRMMAPQLLPYIDTVNNVVVNQFITAYQQAPADKWHVYYDQALRQLPAGLNELVVHLAYDDAEMQAVTIDHPDFGAAWRQNDFNYVTSKGFKELLQKENIRLVTWKAVYEAAQ